MSRCYWLETPWPASTHWNELTALVLATASTLVSQSYGRTVPAVVTREEFGPQACVNEHELADTFFRAQSNITRSKEEAQKIIEAHQERIKSGEISLGDLAVTESDCSSARKRGDLGYFGRGDMQKEFEDAAFALQPGEISGVVDTASGLHLIERLE
jgi:hypothetical protein